jgi:hypothetical protein
LVAFGAVELTGYTLVLSSLTGQGLAMHSSSNSRVKRKAYIISSDDDDNDDDYADAESSKTAQITAPQHTLITGKPQYPHSRKSHIIKSNNAKQIQNALTAWFLDGVHDARGMPWRKRWDPALSAEAKAQRAYEVSTYAFCKVCSNYGAGLGV